MEMPKIKYSIKELKDLIQFTEGEVYANERYLPWRIKALNKIRLQIKNIRIRLVQDKEALKDLKRQLGEAEKVTVELTNHFDVWGNPKDGWEVNNQCIEWRDGVMEDWSRESVMKLLKAKGFFAKHIRQNQIDWEEGDDCWILSQRKDGMPICMLQEVKPEITNK